MDRSVAVFCDVNGRTVSIYEPCTAQIFTRRERVWERAGEFPCDLSAPASRGLAAVRSAVGELIRNLGETRIAVAAEINGVAYSALDAQGFAIFQTQGFAKELLDAVYAQLEAEQAAHMHAKEAAKPLVEELGGGKYFIDLKKLQRERPELSSKQALLPFLQDGKFAELTVICAHQPPWFERLEGMGYSYDVRVLEMNRLEITVKPVR